MVVLVAGCGSPGTEDSATTFGGPGTSSTPTSTASSTMNTGSVTVGDASGTSADSTGGDPIFDLSNGGPIDLPACDEAQWEFGTVPPNVLLVVDKSGSMTEVWSDGGRLVQRWESLVGVVDDIVGNFDDQMNLGLQLYPEHAGGFGSCIVTPDPTIPVTPMAGAMIQASLATANIQGSTPLQSGVQTGIDHLDGIHAADPMGTPQQAMILIADGGISCSENHGATVNAIETAATQAPNPIPTYVVGIDISGFDDDAMNEYAIAGGQPAPGPGNSFYDTQSGDELAAALSLIAGELQSCTVVLDPPPNPELLPYMELEIDGMPYPELEDCDAGDGWSFENGSEDTVVFCGAACVALQELGTVDATYGCPPSG